MTWAGGSICFQYPNPAVIHHRNLPQKMRCPRERARYFPAHFRPMADKANKYSEGVAGKFYVDDQCIDCDLCRETAPANFKRNDDGGHSYVYKQPENADEEKLCVEAMEGCPVEAIGSDGD
jgi:ferredoxin